MTRVPAASVCGWLAGGCALAAYVPYGRAILARRAAPSRLAWLLWCAPPPSCPPPSPPPGRPPAALLLPAAQAAATTATAALALRYGHGSLRTRPAAAALAGTAAALAAWWHWRTAGPAPGLLASLAIEQYGMTLTITAAWRHPGREPPAMWALSAAAGLAALPAAGTRASPLAYLYLASFTASALAVLAAGPIGKRRRPPP